MSSEAEHLYKFLLLILPGTVPITFLYGFSKVTPGMKTIRSQDWVLTTPRALTSTEGQIIDIYNVGRIRYNYGTIPFPETLDVFHISFLFQ